MTTLGPGPHRPMATRPSMPAASLPLPAPARTGAFSLVRARWLPLWALLGLVAIEGLAALGGSVLGLTLSDDVLTTLFYVPLVAWIAVMVVRRGGVDLRAMTRWPHLGPYWWVVAGVLVVQFFFSMGAATLTDLILPGLDDSLAGVGQGNLLLELVALVIVPPLVEELLFRGVLVERFAVKWSVRPAIIVSAVLFAVLHVDPIGAFGFGVVTGVLYVRTRSLWPGILTHLANNLIVLVAVRLTDTAGTTAEAPPTDVAESLLAAGFFLALSVPFLVWFLWRAWPSRGDATPYQQHELVVGLPARSFEGVTWSAAPGPIRLTASATHLVVAPMGSTNPAALLPVDQVAAAYPTAVPGGVQLVVLLRDGTWTTLRVADSSPKTTASLAATIGERAQQAAYRGSFAAG